MVAEAVEKEQVLIKIILLEAVVLELMVKTVLDLHQVLEVTLMAIHKLSH